jgi:hypothetical protein
LNLDPAPDALRRLYYFDFAGDRLIADMILGAGARKASGCTALDSFRLTCDIGSLHEPQ